jgi:predicted alpha/beta hydrolase family esterase
MGRLYNALSEAWGSNFIALGPHGHISTADGFGLWPEGIQYGTELQATQPTKHEALTVNPG